MLYERNDMPKSTFKWLRSIEHETHEKCPSGFSAMMQPISSKSIPSMLVFEINLRSITISKSLQFGQEGETVGLNIRGLLFFACDLATAIFDHVFDLRFQIVISQQPLHVSASKLPHGPI